MQKERGAPIRITLWRHVHIGHVEPLAALRDHEHVYRVRVGEAFKPNAERLFGQNRQCRCPAEQNDKHVANLGSFRSRLVQVTQGHDGCLRF